MNSYAALAPHGRPPPGRAARRGRAPPHEPRRTPRPSRPLGRRHPSPRCSGTARRTSPRRYVTDEPGAGSRVTPVRSPTMLVGRTGLSPTMVGRSAPLARLAGLLTCRRPSERPPGRARRRRPPFRRARRRRGRRRQDPARCASSSRACPGRDRRARRAGRARVRSGGPTSWCGRCSPDALPPEGDDPVRAALEAIERAARRRTRAGRVRGPPLGRRRERRRLRAPGVAAPRPAL